MSTQLDKAKAVAAQIEKRAADALAGLEREMAIMQWRPEFRAIMWGAVVELANRRRVEAEQADRRG